MNVECESFVVEYFLHMYRTGLKFELKSYPNECVSGEFESKLEVIAVAGSSPVTVGRLKIGLVQNITKCHKISHKYYTK